MHIQFIARFKNGQEFCAVEIDGEEEFELEKVESFNPYWIIRDFTGTKIGTIETLLIMQEALENGTIRSFYGGYTNAKN